MNVLLWFSGVDRRLAREFGETGRYVGFGALVALMTVWSTAVMTLAMHTSMHVALPVALAFGVLFGLLMMNVDRLISGMPMMADGFWYRFSRVLLLRAIIAVCIGVFISHAAVLVIYRNDINVLAAERAAAVASDLNAKVDQSAEVRQIGALRQQIQKLSDVVAADQRQVALTTARLQCEQAGTCGTGVPGQGNVTERIQRQLDIENKNLAADTAAKEAQTPILNAEIARFQKLVDARRAAAARVAENSDGYSARSEALWELVRRDPAVLLVALMLLALDLLVPFFKATWPASAVDMHKRREAAIAHRIRAEEDASLDITAAISYAAGQHAHVIRAQADVARDRALARVTGRPDPMPVPEPLHATRPYPTDTAPLPYK